MLIEVSLAGERAASDRPAGIGKVNSCDNGSILHLLKLVREHAYEFTAPTPASQARVLARGDRAIGKTLADLLGWSVPCRAEFLPPEILEALDAAGMLVRRSDGLVQARCRVSNVFGNLFVHSSYPTIAQDSVFLGPDSHRFADFILRNVTALSEGAQILDYGAGAGVGGITAATRCSGNPVLTLADINPKALDLASANAAFADIEHRPIKTSAPVDVDGQFDLIVTHPPFMIDPDRRAYRDGGDLHGGRLSLDWTVALLARLAPGGQLVMHTGAAIVHGRDVLREALQEKLPAIGFTSTYQVLDPDIFGDELDKEPYADVDRIAAVGLYIVRDAGTEG
jgi:methylase of polypeptide subunit release factors